MLVTALSGVRSYEASEHSITISYEFPDVLVEHLQFAFRAGHVATPLVDACRVVKRPRESLEQGLDLVVGVLAGDLTV